MATVTIQKRKRKDRTSYQVSYRDPEDNSHKYYQSFQRQKDAQKAANELRALIDLGKTDEIKKIKGKVRPLTFGQVAKMQKKEWDEELAHKRIRPKTHDGYLDRLMVVTRIFGKTLLFKITEQDIKDYVTSLTAGNSVVTVNKNLRAIKAVFALGKKKGAIKYDPSAKIRCLNEKDTERKKFVLPQVLSKLLEASQRTRAKFYMRSIILLGAEHGASKQEILDLNWPDIDFDYEETGFIRLYRTKNKRERFESLMPRTREALLEWGEHQRWMRRRRQIEDIKSDRVFCRLDGTPLKGFNKAWGITKEIAGVNGFHFHDLRHTFCSNLLLSGSDIKDVKEMIGHKDLAMTDRYSHLTVQHKRSCQERLAKHYETGV